jgi:hypothetical protein
MLVMFGCVFTRLVYVTFLNTLLFQFLSPHRTNKPHQASYFERTTPFFCGVFRESWVHAIFFPCRAFLLVQLDFWSRPGELCNPFLFVEFVNELF